jgi:hypothetical protein
MASPRGTVERWQPEIRGNRSLKAEGIDAWMAAYA